MIAMKAEPSRRPPKSAYVLAGALAGLGLSLVLLMGIHRFEAVGVLLLVLSVLVACWAVCRLGTPGNTDSSSDIEKEVHELLSGTTFVQTIAASHQFDGLPPNIH